MPRYKYALTNGKSLILEGDTEPSVDDVEAAAREQRVQLKALPSDEIVGINADPDSPRGLRSRLIQSGRDRQDVMKTSLGLLTPTIPAAAGDALAALAAGPARALKGARNFFSRDTAADALDFVAHPQRWTGEASAALRAKSAPGPILERPAWQEFTAASHEPAAPTSRLASRTGTSFEPSPMPEVRKVQVGPNEPIDTVSAVRHGGDTGVAAPSEIVQPGAASQAATTKLTVEGSRPGAYLTAEKARQLRDMYGSDTAGAVVARQIGGSPKAWAALIKQYGEKGTPIRASLADLNTRLNAIGAGKMEPPPGGGLTRKPVPQAIQELLQRFQGLTGE